MAFTFFNSLSLSVPDLNFAAGIIYSTLSFDPIYSS